MCVKVSRRPLVEDFVRNLLARLCHDARKVKVLCPVQLVVHDSLEGLSAWFRPEKVLDWFQHVPHGRLNILLRLCLWQVGIVFLQLLEYAICVLLIQLQNLSTAVARILLTVNAAVYI